MPATVLCEPNQDEYIEADVEFLYDTYDELVIEEGKECLYYGPTKDE